MIQRFFLKFAAMKIKICVPLIILFFLILEKSHAQFAGDFKLGIGANTFMLANNNAFAESYGIDADYYITDWLSIQYRYSLIVNVNRKVGFGAPMGFYGAIVSFSNIVFQNGTETFWLLAGIVSILVPDGIALHFPLEREKNQVSFGPFVNVLSTEYNLLDRKEVKGFGSVGLRLDIPFREQFIFSPYVGSGLLYGENYQSNWGGTAGISGGVVF